ncbi:MAG: PrgI family protein [Oscillospiraceae bacterium]
MPFVPVPKDLSKVKTKVAFNLTKRQLICFSVAAAIGVPTYLLTKGTIGNTAAVFLMIGLMLPFFFFSMYERDSQPAEKLLRNIIRAKWLFPPTRPYKTDNLYRYLEQEGNAIESEKPAAGSPAKKAGRQRPAGKRPQG